MIWILALVSAAAICNAVMDILENENFYSSRFAHLNPKFWYKRESWQHAKKILNWKFDGWHVFKSAMVWMLLWGISDSFFQWVVLGIVWNVSFNLTYKFLKK